MLSKNVVFAPEAGSSMWFLRLSLDVHHLRPVSFQDIFILVFCVNQTLAEQY